MVVERVGQKGNSSPEAEPADGELWSPPWPLRTSISPPTKGQYQCRRRCLLGWLTDAASWSFVSVCRVTKLKYLLTGSQSKPPLLAAAASSQGGLAPPLAGSSSAPCSCPPWRRSNNSVKTWRVGGIHRNKQKIPWPKLNSRFQDDITHTFVPLTPDRCSNVTKTIKTSLCSCIEFCLIELPTWPSLWDILLASCLSLL